MSGERYQVVIVGAGLVGSAAALALGALGVGGGGVGRGVVYTTGAADELDGVYLGGGRMI